MTAMQWGASVLAAGGCWSHVMLVVGMAKGIPDDRLHKYAAGTLVCLLGGLLLAAASSGWPDGMWALVVTSHILGLVSALDVFRERQPVSRST